MISHKFSEVIFKSAIAADSPQNHRACYLDFVPKKSASGWVSRLLELGAYGICVGDFSDRNYVKIHFWVKDEVIIKLKDVFPDKIIEQLSLF